MKQIQRVSSVPGRTYTYLNLADAIRAVRAGKDINYEGSAGRSTSTRRATSAALYNVYSYKDGKQDVVRTLRIRK